MRPLLTALLLSLAACAHEPPAPPHPGATKHLPAPSKEQQRRQLLAGMTPMMGLSEAIVVDSRGLKCKLIKSNGRKSRYKCNFYWFPDSYDWDPRHADLVLYFEDDRLTDWKRDDD